MSLLNFIDDSFIDLIQSISSNWFSVTTIQSSFYGKYFPTLSLSHVATYRWRGSPSSFPLSFTHWLVLRNNRATDCSSIHQMINAHVYVQSNHSDPSSLQGGPYHFNSESVILILAPVMLTPVLHWYWYHLVSDKSSVTQLSIQSFHSYPRYPRVSFVTPYPFRIPNAY